MPTAASTRGESAGEATAPSAPAASRPAEDPRLEPMRRVADQVTLRFEGENGLEGRLRIAVRGDTVHASILSSHEGTLRQLGSEMGALRRALADQGFGDAKVSVHDTRGAAAAGSGGPRDGPRTGDDRRGGGDPQRRAHERESRPEDGAEGRHRNPREERRSE